MNFFSIIKCVKSDVSEKPFLLGPGNSPIFCSHPIVKDIEQACLEKIRILLEIKTTDVIWLQFLREIMLARQNRMHFLMNPQGSDFSYSHCDIPRRMRMFFYEICEHHGINPGKIIIKARDGIDFPIASSYSEIRRWERRFSRETVYIVLNSVYFHRKPIFWHAVFAHELGHLLHADSETIILLRDLIDDYERKNGIFWQKIYDHQKQRYINVVPRFCGQFPSDSYLIGDYVNAMWVNKMEKTADLLLPSRDICDAHAIYAYYHDESSNQKILKYSQTGEYSKCFADEPLISSQRSCLGYPLWDEQKHSLCDNLEKIWGKNWERCL